MDIGETINVFLSLMGGVVGALVSWFKMKGRIDVMDIEIINTKNNSEVNSKRLSEEVMKLRLDKKEEISDINSRIEKITDLIAKMDEKNNNHALKVEGMINTLKIELIQEIHKIGKNEH